MSIVRVAKYAGVSTATVPRVLNDNDELALSPLTPRSAAIDLGSEEIGFRVVRRLRLKIENPDKPPVFIQTMPRLMRSNDEAANANTSGQTSQIRHLSEETV